MKVEEHVDKPKLDRTIITIDWITFSIELEIFGQNTVAAKKTLNNKHIDSGLTTFVVIRKYIQTSRNQYWNYVAV